MEPERPASKPSWWPDTRMPPPIPDKKEPMSIPTVGGIWKKKKESMQKQLTDLVITYNKEIKASAFPEDSSHLQHRMITNLFNPFSE